MRRKGYYEDITTFLVKHTFHTRFFLASLSQKSKIAKKIIDKLLFEDDEIFVLPNKKSINKNYTYTNNSKNKNNENNKNDENNKNNKNNLSSDKISDLKTTETTITTKIDINQSFEKDDSEFLPSEILKRVIKESKDIVIMKKCLCRSSADCKDYPKDLGCIFIGETSRKIPLKYGKPASVEEALAHVDLADNAGLSHVIGRNKIDTVWMNIGPKEKLLTICHCCPCCCLWKVLPDLDDDISNKVMRLEDVEVKIIKENCKHCNNCLKENVCFGNAIKLENNNIVIDQDKCVGCGHCVNVCKFNAIELNYSQNSIDSVLKRIGELVDYKN